VTLGERIDTKQNLGGIRLGNPNGKIDRTDRYVGALNIESIAKNNQLNDQVASCTRRPLQLKTPPTPDASIDTRFQQHD
jgi:hypothetical protein